MKKWASEDDNFLIENYPLYGVKYCMEKLKRSKRSIEQRARKNKLHYNGIKEKYFKENLEPIVKESFTYCECLRKLGIHNFGSSTNTLKKYIKKYELDTSHFLNDNIKKLIFNKTIPLLNVLVKNSTYTSSSRLKERLYNEGLKDRKCEMCNQGEEWNGKHMSLILDHINGIHNDNRIENLRIVCPNCNATLETHCKGNYKKETKIKYCKCGKKIYKKSNYCNNCVPRKRKVENRPSLEILSEEIKTDSYVNIGKKYGVTDNCVRKWIKNYGVDPPKKMKIS